MSSQGKEKGKVLSRPAPADAAGTALVTSVFFLSLPPQKHTNSQNLDTGAKVSDVSLCQMI